MKNLNTVDDPQEEDLPPCITFGMRIPKDYFVTSGQGESDITVHAGSYHLALKEAGIEMCNIISYSSIIPKIAREVEKPKVLTHGAVLESITAVSSSERGNRATAGIIYAWLYDRKTGERYGGLVCEYNGNDDESMVNEQLRASLNELYINGFDEQFELRDERLTIRSFVPTKKHGTALVAVCFVNYVFLKLD